MNTRQMLQFASRARDRATGMILLLAGCGMVGCGPTHTAGTRGTAAKDLSILSIPQLPAVVPLRIETIQFDGAGEAYQVGKSRDFYLLPRDHTASFTFKAIIPGEAGIPGWLVPQGALTFPGPKDIPLGEMTAGKTYELAFPQEGFDKLMETGRLSLVREKGK
ncbi:MAG: hypothetical protein JWM57_1617 [Phycisphaerales bacterium]|nr:hypothetical protein [Phycisphaerales bacterium]